MQIQLVSGEVSVLTWMRQFVGGPRIAIGPCQMTSAKCSTGRYRWSGAETCPLPTSSHHDEPGDPDGDRARQLMAAATDPPTIEILYLDGCPSHEKLLPIVERLADQTGAALRLRCVETPDAAETERFLGSPTVRVNGVDVDLTASERTDFGLKCRIYRSDDNQSPLPPERWIHEALKRSRAR